LFEETNREELIIPPKSPKKSDVERHVKDSEKRTTTIIKNLIEQFVNNFNHLHSKKRKGRKYNASHKEETMTIGVVLNILNNAEIEDARLGLSMQLMNL
jgi:hypothetical protein